MGFYCEYSLFITIMIMKTHCGVHTVSSGQPYSEFSEISSSMKLAATLMDLWRGWRTRSGSIWLICSFGLLRF